MASEQLVSSNIFMNNACFIGAEGDTDFLNASDVFKSLALQIYYGYSKEEIQELTQHKKWRNIQKKQKKWDSQTAETTFWFTASSEICLP